MAGNVHTKAALISVLFLAGCNPQSSRVSPGSFRITTMTDLETVTLVVKHLRIEAHGTRQVSISEGEGNRDSATIDADQRTGMMTADVYLIADLISRPSGPGFLKWLVRIQSPGGHVGGPFEGPGSAASLDEMLTLETVDGEYPLARSVRLGRFRETDVVLTVE